LDKNGAPTPADRNQSLPVGGEGNRRGPVVAVSDLEQLLAGGRVPDTGLFILARRGESLAVRTEAQPVDGPVGVGSDPARLFPGRRVAEADDAVLAGAGQGLAVRCKGHAGDRPVRSI